MKTPSSIEEMPRDSTSKKEFISKKEQAKRSLNRRKYVSSDSSDSEESDQEEMDMHEYRKLLQELFPSKYMKRKVKSGEKVKRTLQSSKSRAQLLSESEDSDEESQEDDEEEEEEEEDEQEEDTEEENEEVEAFQRRAAKKGKSNVNIILSIGDLDEDEEEWEDVDDDEEETEDSDTEDEDVSVSSGEEEDDEEDEEEEEVQEVKKNTREQTHAKKRKATVETLSVEEMTNKQQALQDLKELLVKHPHDKSIQKCIQVYELEIQAQQEKQQRKQRKQKAKHMRIFRKIMMDKNTMNDFAFYDKLDTLHQRRIIKELREINKVTRIEKPYRISLLESNIPIPFKAAAFKKINSLRYMEPGSGDFYKIKNWVDTFMRIPFTEHCELPISIEHGVEKCHDFMENAKHILDQAVYGLNDAKMQIMQMLGQLITNPKSMGTAIAIHGPPGTGKTSLVKEGISKILNRPFAFIALGGATDSSFLEGHGYTYEGSTWGRIVQILIDSKCMNPVIYFDELDKISDTPRGEEIVGILTHLTDTSQNSEFHDKYFAEIKFDLSKCLFIFSYNDESKVNPILRDRMYRIKTKGYSSKEKTVIANDYLLPRIREQVKFSSTDVVIPDEVIRYIHETHCNKEDGVRNMKRCLEIIHTKLNLYRLMRPGSNLFENEMALKVEFPFHVTKDIVDKLIKKDQDTINNHILNSLYV